MSLTDYYSFRYRDDGVVLNGDSSTVPFIDVLSVDGLDNAPFRATNRAREGDDGGFVDAEFEDMRTIVLEGNIYAAPGSLESLLDSLKSNFAPQRSPQPFYLLAEGVGERTIFCKSLGMRYRWTTDRGLGQVAFQIQLQAEDPTIYGPAQTLTATLAGVSTGYGYNKSYNRGYGGTTGTVGAVTLNNSGNRDTGGQIVITGPVTNPAVVHDNTGYRLQFNITLAVGETLVVDLRNRTVLLNGTTNRRGTMLGTSTWFKLSPGYNSIRFLGTSAGTPTLGVTFRPAYR